MNDAATSKWFSFDFRHEKEFEDELALSCFIGKLFHYWQGRIAWWGTWSETYPGDDSFSIDLSEIKVRIEKKRTQGSKWTIAELPVLVLAGKDDELIVGEINTDSPLSEIILPRTFDLSLECLAELFRPRKPNSVFRFVGESSMIKPAQIPFLRHRSESWGSSYMLQWNISNGGADLRPLLKLVTRICRRMQKQ